MSWDLRRGRRHRSGRHKKYLTKMNNTITEMTNTLEGINGRINELEDRMVEITAMGQNNEDKNEQK